MECHSKLSFTQNGMSLKMEGEYLTVYPELSLNTDNISFNSHKANNSVISLIDN